MGGQGARAGRRRSRARAGDHARLVLPPCCAALSAGGLASRLGRLGSSGGNVRLGAAPVLRRPPSAPAAFPLLAAGLARARGWQVVVVLDVCLVLIGVDAPRALASTRHSSRHAEADTSISVLSCRRFVECLATAFVLRCASGYVACLRWIQADNAALRRCLSCLSCHQQIGWGGDAAPGRTPG